MKQQKLYRLGIVTGAALSALVSVSTVHASSANNPEIMNIFVALEHNTSSPPNIFMLLDDSGSMATDMRYDSDTEYQLPPNPSDFNTDTGGFLPMPIPSNSRYSGFLKDFTYPNGNNDPYDGFRGSLCQPTSAENCKIFNAFYSTRMLALKSSLAIALTSQTNQYLLDHDFINNNTLDNIKLGDMGRSSGSYRTNMAAFLTSLYKTGPNGATPFLKETSKLFKKIRDSSSSKNKTNIFSPLDKNIAYKKENLHYCKKNYAILLSDGNYNLGGTYKNGETYFDSKNRTFKYFPSSVKHKDMIAAVSNSDYSARVEEEFIGDGSIKGQRLMAGGNRSYYTWEEQIKKSNGYWYTTGNTYQYPTLSDVVMRGWAEDLGGDLMVDKVATTYAKEGNAVLKDSYNRDAILPEFWNPVNDPANWQHITTYTIGVAVGTPWTSKFMADKINKSGSKASWPTVTDDNSDYDFARAGYVGRGGFYRVDTSTELLNAFTKIFEDIEKESQTQAVSSAATSASQITTKTTNILLTTGVNSIDWTGTLTGNWMYSGIVKADGEGRMSDSYECFGSVVPDDAYTGKLCTKSTAKWRAENVMPATENDRKIFSISDKNNTGLSGTGISGTKGISFEYTKMNTAQQKVFKNMLSNGTTSGIESVTDPSKLVDFIRGDNILATHEDIRLRKNGTNNNVPLGDFGRGSPIYLGPPNEKIWGESNSTTQKSRHYVFVGANDGMLHAFDATNGSEAFAFVPNAVYPRFERLIKTKQPHSAFVDGSPAVHDIIDTAGKKKSILVSGMGRGARGLFALDVTEPNSFAKKNVLWELQDERLGHVYGKPSIIRVEGNYAGEDDRWVIVVGTGYNNTVSGKDPTGNSKTQKSGIMVIDPITGDILQFLELPEAQGVGEIAWLDHQRLNIPGVFSAYLGENSFYGEADRGYVGDLNGNLWVLDFSYESGLELKTMTSGNNELRSAVVVGNTNAGGNNDVKDVAKKVGIGLSKKAFAPGAAAPLFIATDADGFGNRQPISAKPMIIKHPSNRGYMIYFGTGELFRVAPMVSHINSMYGIWDDIGDNYGSPAVGSPKMTDHNKTRSRLYLTEYRWKAEIMQFASSGDSAYVRVLDENSIKVKHPITWANFHGNDDSAPIATGSYPDGPLPSSGWVINVGKKETKESKTGLGQNERIFQSPYSVTNSSGQEGIAFLMSTLTESSNPCDGKSQSSTWTMAYRTDSIDGPLTPFSQAVLDLNQDGSIDGKGSDGKINDDDMKTSDGKTTTPMGAVPMKTGLLGGMNGVGQLPTSVQSFSKTLDGSCNGLLRSYKVVTDDELIEDGHGGTVRENIDEINICIPQPMSSWSEIE